MNDPRGDRRTQLKRRFITLLSLLVAHIAFAWQLPPVIGLMTIAYVFFPPTIVYVVFDTIRLSPLLALMIYGIASMVLLALWRPLRPRLQWLNRPFRLLVQATLALWLCVGTGELIRLALISPNLSNLRPQCHGERWLIDSLQRRYVMDFEPDGVPHAWMVRDGGVWLWSYRTLTFEPVRAWSGASSALAQCRSGGSDAPPQ